MFNRIRCAATLFWFGLRHPDRFTETAFVSMGKLLEAALHVASKDRPFTTHMIMGEHRIVSFWMYPGVEKNPVDRIEELVREIDTLKGMLNSAVQDT